MIQRRELPCMFGSVSCIVPCTFVASTIESRRFFSALPTISSDSPRAYTSAVSMKLIPASSARWMTRIDSSWSGLPQAPNIIAPRHSGLTCTPVLPRLRSSMPRSLLSGHRRLLGCHRRPAPLPGVRQRGEDVLHLLAQRLVGRREGEALAERLQRFVGGEAGADRGELEQHAARLAEVHGAEVEAVDHLGGAAAGPDDTLAPRLVLVHRARPRDVVDGAPTRDPALVVSVQHDPAASAL